VGDQERFEVAEGDGPVHALDTALRKALYHFYPELKNIKLTDFKVRVVNVSDGTAARVRTIIDSTDGNEVWSTVGVSENMIEASWKALVEGVIYGLLRNPIS
jgi:2-isopropylmalate synthase